MNNIIIFPKPKEVHFTSPKQTYVILPSQQVKPGVISNGGTSVNNKTTNISQIVVSATYVENYEELFNINTWADKHGINQLKAGQPVLVKSDNSLYVINNPEYYQYLADKDYYYEIITAEQYNSLLNKSDYIPYGDNYRSKKAVSSTSYNRTYEAAFSGKGWIKVGPFKIDPALPQQVEDNTSAISRLLQIINPNNKIPVRALGGPGDGLLFNGDIISAEYLPSYVDNVVECNVILDQQGRPIGLQDNENNEITPTSGVMYLDITTNSIYRWGGTKLAQVSSNYNPKFEEGTTSEISIGGLAKDTDISGLSVKEVLQTILSPDYAPVWYDATLTLPSNQTFKVGATIPAQNTFSVGGNPAYTVGKTTAHGGSGSTTLYINDNVLTFGSIVDTRRTVAIIAHRSYENGTEQVVSFKGTPTNRTATVEKVNLTEASVNNNIDPTTNRIVQMYKQGIISLYYTWPVYINGTEKVEYNTTSYEVTKQLAANETLTFSMPNSYTNVKIQYWDSAANVYQTMTDQFTISVNNAFKVNNISKAYKTYTYSEVAGRGSTKYKITFNIA